VTEVALPFAGSACMILGGLGFIGSNLAHRLVALGARVLIVDSLSPTYGANLFNVHEIRDRVHVNVTDLRDEHAMAYLVRGQQYIFNLAGQSGHVQSMEDPQTDLRINTEGALTVLEACRHHNRQAKVLYASTRNVYGRPTTLPVTEDSPVAPIDNNAVANLASEQYHLLYHEIHGIRTTSLRLTNTYGPRQMMKDDRGRFGMIYFWIRRIIDGQPLQIMGGHQERDFTYIDDCVEALLRAAAAPVADGQIYNLGGPVIGFSALADLLIEIAGGGTAERTELPPERRAIDPGQVYLSYEKIKGALGWEPKVGLRDGLARTIAYYREHREQYWDASDVEARQVGGLQVSLS
jgi:UDP-glucose 4-epimerase